MENLKNNFAYIDGNNLHQGVKDLGWIIDYFRLRRWLTEKYGVVKAYIFLGYMQANQRLYQKLRRAGFILIFKSLSYQANGKAKGNCDAELVLNAVIDFYEYQYDQAILVSGDGDFACLASFLLNRKVLGKIIAPNRKQCSYLIRKIYTKSIYDRPIFLDDFRFRLAVKEKTPDTDGTV
ncbi:MAG: NYN domain-containing protein [Patescibacteria group bacterium]